jgi:hypothetical protein
MTTTPAISELRPGVRGGAPAGSGDSNLQPPVSLAMARCGRARPPVGTVSAGQNAHRLVRASDGLGTLARNWWGKVWGPQRSVCLCLIEASWLVVGERSWGLARPQERTRPRITLQAGARL